MPPSIGRIVRYVLPDGQLRPAIIVRVWADSQPTDTTLVNLQVFTDGENDTLQDANSIKNILWKTSVHQDYKKSPGTFHFPDIK